MDNETLHIETLDLIVAPCFCVKAGRIFQCNAAAKHLPLPLGAEIALLLATGQKEYTAYEGGSLYLTLDLSGTVFGAEVERRGELDFFVLEGPAEPRELRVLSLAAAELRLPLSGILASAEALAEQSGEAGTAQVASLNRGLAQLLRLVGNMSAASSGTSHQALVEITGIFREIFEGNILRSGCTQLFSDLTILSISFCKKQGIPYEKVYTHRTGVMEYVAQMEKLRECGKFFHELFAAIIREKKVLEGQNGYSVPVRKMVSYIHQHYMDGISLGDAADNAGMNSSYLSTLFKNEVGTGFVEYLNEVRLERAKELMDSSQLRLKEIIDEVGFCSYPYFFSLFKKKYGMTPKEYQKGQGR